MGRVWYTSDTHFDHKLVAGLRGFETTAEHDRAIIANWNKVVGKGDTVWHLGDVGMGRYERFADQLEELNGFIHLVTGNHDEPFPGMRDSWRKQRRWLPPRGRFESVQAFARRRVDGRMFLLSHFPYDGDHSKGDRYTQYRLRDEGMWLVHGHLHTSQRHTGPRQFHVGLDAWGLHPVSQEDIIREMDSKEVT